MKYNEAIQIFVVWLEASPGKYLARFEVYHASLIVEERVRKCLFCVFLLILLFLYVFGFVDVCQFFVLFLFYYHFTIPCWGIHALHLI